jgi:hypothetical protein
VVLAARKGLQKSLTASDDGKPQDPARGKDSKSKSVERLHDAILRLELGSLPMAGRDAGKTSVTQPCVGHSSKHR